MKLLTHYSQIPSDQWDSLVENSPVSSWFQTREAYDFFDSLSFTEPFVYGVDEDNKIVCLTVGYVQGDGGWVKQTLSRRAIIIGGPLLTSQTTGVQLSTMLSFLRESFRKRCIYIEIRNLNNYSRWRGTFTACGFDYVPHYNFHQDTSSIDAINSKLSRTRKRHIHVGLRDGAIIEEVHTDKEENELYSILSNLYRNKVKKPLPPQEFFHKLRNIPSARLLIVKCQERVIGGMAYVSLSGRVGYEWYVCGQDETYKNLYPSELATYAGLQYAANSGCSRFDYMGAGKPGVSYGVRDFKALFGGQLVEYGRFLHISHPWIYKAGKLAIELFGKIS